MAPSQVPQAVAEKDPAVNTHHEEDQIANIVKPHEVVADAAVKGQATSGYETLTLWETIKTFKIATAYCFAAAFSAGADGYQMA
jgi:hypothetical protein